MRLHLFLVLAPAKELLRLLDAENPVSSLRAMAATGILAQIFPDGTQLERLEPAAEQIDVLRRVDRAHDAAQLANRFELFGRANDHPGQEIVVATQILGRRVHHVVDARGQRRDGTSMRWP